MEPRFGHDFSRVRVHSGATAERSARDVSADAYTVGHDIVFGAGRFATGTPDGRRLIAHELTHVLQQTSGGMVGGVVQRKQGGSPRDGGTHTAGPYNSYIDLMNGFQELAAAAINRGGAGLDTVRFGSDLSRSHRRLLGRVRTVLIQAQEQDHDTRVAAAGAWPGVAAQLHRTVDEARSVGLPGEALAAVVDQIALLGRNYVHARRRKSDPEVQTPEDYADTLMGLQELLAVFGRMGEPGEGLLREEVPNRKDAVVSLAVREANAKQRAALGAVKLGRHLNRRRAKALNTLRAALILARTETSGSASQALARWRSAHGELLNALKAVPRYVDGDIGPVQQAFVATGEVLARHYTVVHSDNVRVALTRERLPEQARTDRAMSEAMPPGVLTAMKEARVLEDFGYALTVLEQHLTPSPDREGEWVLTSGGTVIRVRADQVESMRAAAGTALKRFMADITTVMVDAWQTYDSIKRGNSSFKLHVLGGWGGATDPGDQEDVKNSVMHIRDTVVYPLVDQGRYVEAYRTVMGQKGVVERHAREVGDYDADLDSGYNRLSTAMKVVQVALVSLVPVAGEAALVGGASVWAVGGTAVVAGSGGAAGAETGRQLASGEGVDPGKIGKAAYSGGLVGVSAVAPAATKGLGRVFAAGGEGTTLVGANALASGTVGAVQSNLGGGDAIEGFAGGFVGSLGGSATKGLGSIAQRPLVNVGIQGGVGATTAALTGGDPVAGAVGGIAGAVGGTTVPQPSRGGGSTQSATSDAGKTLPGVGIPARRPAPASGGGGGGGGAAGRTIPGVDIAARQPAASGGSSGGTLLGVGIPARRPAGAGAGETLPGVGMPARPPGGSAHETLPGVGVPGRRPAPGGGGGSPSSGPSRSGDTQESIPAAPGRTPARRTRFAALPQYASRRPVMGRVVHIVDSPDDAAALYVRLNREGQRNILGTSDPDIEMMSWRGDGGEGDPPMAWVRQGDGVVRFNFGRFPRPNLGGYTTEPFPPLAGWVRGASAGTRPAPPPGGGGVVRSYARLPEHAARPPLYGPQSKVAYVITDLQEAQRIWSRLLAERQLNMLEHDGDFAEQHWTHDGGVGDVPIAWVRTGDGVIRFNLAKFTHPPAAGAPR